MGKVFALALWGSSVIIGQAVAQGMNIGNFDAILKSASEVAEDLMALYNGRGEEVAGRWPKKSEYTYWTGSALMGALIDYWHLTNDSTYNDIVKEAMLLQASEDTFTPSNLMPSYLGNNDQCSWALAAMQAAEAKFPEPSEDQKWISMAQAVFSQQKQRLDEEDNFCGGGLRWGISASHHGWTWKDGRSNSCLFTLAARLARYTGNSTYSDTAEEVYDWMTKTELINPDKWRVVAGASVTDECATKTELYSSIDGAQVVQGAAFMFNHTDGSDEWRNRLEKLTPSVLKDFYPSNQPFEPGCQLHQLCSSDHIAFQGVTTRSLAVVTQLASFTSEPIFEALGDTAKVIALGCKNGESKRECQYYWLDLDPELIMEEDEPEASRVSKQMNALAAFSNLLVRMADAPSVAPSSSQGSSSSGSPTGSSGSSPSGSSGSGSGGSTQEGAGQKLFGAPSFALIVLGLVASCLL